MRVTIAELRSMTGATIRQDEPVVVPQRDIDDFARVTGDAQWIHVDPERAAGGPFGATIVHGYLLLSHLGGFWMRSLEVTDASEGVNYGLDRVRFIRPVPVDSALSMRAIIREARALDGDRVGVRIFADVELRIEGDERPAVVAATILQYTS